MNYQIIEADITKQCVDAIVNAANERCLGGDGVDTDAFAMQSANGL